MIREVYVDLHLTSKPGSPAAAVADVSIDLAEAGKIELYGFRVMAQDGKPPWVSLPARKSDRGRWFDSIALRGPVRELVITAILQEFTRATTNGGARPESSAQ